MKQYAEIMPAVNELEFHPRYASPELRRVAKELGVVLIGYGSGTYTSLSQQPEIEAIAKKIGKTPLEVVLRWTTQLGVGIIPRSKSPNHLAENFAINSFTLADEDMSTLNSLNQDYPYYWDPVPSAKSFKEANL